MKSIANQYRDLKEGRMSQFNFMRNLRMSMPQYITNVTSFKDAVRILKNKAILTEADIAEVRFQSPGGVDYPGRERQPEYDEGVFSDELVDELEKAELNPSPYFNVGEEQDLNGLQDFVKNLNQEIYDKVIDETFPDSDATVQRFIEMFLEDKELSSQIDRMEDEESGRYTTGYDQFEITEGKKKKAKKEEKPYNPNAIHPSELRMGIKVEMEHTDDLDKAKKIALDHLAENPYYYTALKLAGVESPSAPKAKPVAPKKIKKKDATEMTDPANQMQKVKLVKESLEKLIRAELKKY